MEKNSGYVKVEALQSSALSETGKELLVNMINLLVLKGELSKTEGNQVKQLIANDKDRGCKEHV